MKRQSHLLSAFTLGAALAIGFPAAGQQEDPQEQQTEQQRGDQQQREEAQQDQERPEQPPRPGERSDQQRPDEPQRARDGQQQQQGDRQERQRRAMLGIAFAQDGQSQPGQEGRQQQDSQQQEGQRQGLEIIALMPGGAAEQANLRQGDSIISVNGQEVRSAEEVDRIVQQRSVGDTLDLVILRDGERQETQVTLQAAPERDGREGQDARRPDFDRGARASSRGWLGVTLDTRNERSVGATIERVYPAGPAARAGLRQGDRIVQVTGREVSGYQDVLQALTDTRPGETVELTVDSNGQQQQVSVRLDDAGVFSDGEEEFDSSTMWRDQSGRTGQIPEHDMMLEQHRRFAEQHERIEDLLREVQRDIQEIKQQLNGQSARQPGQPARQPAERSPQRTEGQAPPRPDGVQQPPTEEP
jgi:C-terminal processing protease CtpA/Prc